jgi:16S rRNA (uracil1498-N3)-methyltransferase
MADRYFVETPIVSDRAVLADAEAHHLVHVMRAKPGLEVVLFDGTGAEFLARVERTGRSEVELQVLARQEVDRELPVPLVLGVALPKGDRQKWLVEKTVELGVGQLVPLITCRSVAQPVEKALERLRRAVIEASKQCGRNRLMDIAEPQPWGEFVRNTTPTDRRWLAHPGTKKRQPLSLDQPPHRVLLAVGPEGGFTDDEVDQAIEAGWDMVDLGPRILRVETAALLLAGLAAQQ